MGKRPEPAHLQDLLDRRYLAGLERTRRVVVEDDEPVVEAVDALLICAAAGGVKACAALTRPGTHYSTAGAAVETLHRVKGAAPTKQWSAVSR